MGLGERTNRGRFGGGGVEWSCRLKPQRGRVSPKFGPQDGVCRGGSRHGKKRGLTWEGGSVARGLGTPVTAGRRRERRGRVERRGWRGVPQPGPLALPHVSTHTGWPTSPSALRKGANEGLTRRSLLLKPLHLLLELPNMSLQVSVPGLGLVELTEGR